MARGLDSHAGVNPGHFGDSTQLDLRRGQQVRFILFEKILYSGSTVPEHQGAIAGSSSIEPPDVIPRRSMVCKTPTPAMPPKITVWPAPMGSASWIGHLVRMATLRHVAESGSPRATPRPGPRAGRACAENRCIRQRPHCAGLRPPRSRCRK